MRHPTNGQICKSLFAQGIAMGMGLLIGSVMERVYFGQDKLVCAGVWLMGVVVLAMSWIFRFFTEKYWPKDEVSN
jgi:hypothetical protein